MDAIVKKLPQKGLWMENVPIPEIGDDDVLIKTRKTSICGTDLHIYNWDSWAKKNLLLPTIIGHEFMGEIASLGRNVTHLKIGDRVSGEGHIVCGHCIPCRTEKRHLCLHTKGLGVQLPGCFAEYFSLPAQYVFPLPDRISDEVGAILDPFGNATHAALSFDLAGEDVLISGTGPIGIMAAAISRKAGARHVIATDINDYRLDLARKMGASATINVTRDKVADVMRELGLEDGFTVGLEMSGSEEGIKNLLETAQHGAKIALLGIIPSGIAIDWDLVIFKMLLIKGIYGREIFGTWYKMVHLLESGLDLEPVITHHLAASEFEKGFEILFSGRAGKVILDW
ncbi:MAG: L-threonine 3-dehydrogenase [Parachlamydia sp.]|nr:L-threonine 3-dehydrogenase [Parachlamydia sp.]